MRGHARAAGLADSVVDQYVRRDAGSRAPGRAEHPQGAPRAAGCDRSSSPAAPPRSSRNGSRRCPRSTHVLGNGEKMRAESWQRFGQAKLLAAERGGTAADAERCTAARASRRHHGADADGASHDRQLQHPRARLCRDPEWLRSPLHVLHHSLWPWSIALGAARTGSSRRSAVWSRPAPSEIVLTGVDMTSWGGDLGQVRAARRSRPGRFERRSRTATPALVFHRFDRGGSGPGARHGRRRTVDAASASLVAGRRRHDPQAHEAAAFRARTRSRFAPKCGGCVPISSLAPI